jgi:hypothetical protein
MPPHKGIETAPVWRRLQREAQGAMIGSKGVTRDTPFWRFESRVPGPDIQKNGTSFENMCHELRAAGRETRNSFRQEENYHSARLVLGTGARERR